MYENELLILYLFTPDLLYRRELGRAQLACAWRTPLRPSWLSSRPPYFGCWMALHRTACWPYCRTPYWSSSWACRCRLFSYKLQVVYDKLQLSHYCKPPTCDLSIFLPAKSFPGCNEDIHSINLVYSKLKLLVLFPLGLRWILNDRLLAVNPVLLQLVGQHPLDRL